jgi:hypothetical protein
MPMTDAIEINLGRKPEQLSADAGYCSEANLEALENRNIDVNRRLDVATLKLSNLNALGLYYRANGSAPAR